MRRTASISSSVQSRPRSAPGIGARRGRPARARRQGAAERGAGVAGRRLHPDLLERALGEEPGVGDAVERHTAGQGQVAAPVRSCSQPASSSSTSSSRLQAAARSACVGGPGRRPCRGAARTRPVDGSVRKPPSPVAWTNCPEVVEEARLAVRGQGHHLVLIGAAQEPEMLGHVLVQQAQRVRQLLAGQRLQRAVVEAAGEMAVRLAAAVEDQHRAVRRTARPGRPTPRAPRGAARTGPCRVQAREGRGQERRRPLGVILRRSSRRRTGRAPPGSGTARGSKE